MYCVSIFWALVWSVCALNGRLVPQRYGRVKGITTFSGKMYLMKILKSEHVKHSFVRLHTNMYKYTFYSYIYAFKYIKQRQGLNNTKIHSFIHYSHYYIHLWLHVRKRSRGATTGAHQQAICYTGLKNDQSKKSAEVASLHNTCMPTWLAPQPGSRTHF